MKIDWPQPFQWLTIEPARTTAPFPAYVKEQEEIGVSDLSRGEARGGKACELGFYSELLAQLADERRLSGFAHLDLSARELPQAGHRSAWGSLLNEHAAVGINERGGDHQYPAHPPMVLIIRLLT